MSGLGRRLSKVLSVTLPLCIATGPSAAPLPPPASDSTGLKGLAADSPAQGTLLDRVVAVVDGRVITLSELEFEARVALIDRGGVQATHEVLDLPTLRNALELAISERLETWEADKLQAFALNEGDLPKRLLSFQEKVGGPLGLEAFLARQDADRPLLEEVLGRSMRAERILDGKVHLKAQVTEVDVRREFDQHPSTYGASFEAVHSAIRERLTRQRYALLAREELATIRSAGAVRLLPPFARREGGEP